MSLDRPPAGTTYSQRKKQLETMSFMDVRILGTMTYKDQAGVPILDASETLHVNKRPESIEKVLQFELANNLIVHDGSSPQQTPTGAESMTQPFQPQMMPPPSPNGAPQQPQFQGQPPQMPMPPGVPGGQPPQMVMPTGAPFGMPPMGPPGVPQQPMMTPPPPPGAPPPVASPQQAAGQEQAPTGKKKRGSAAAPPPPPPPAPAQAPQAQFAQPQAPQASWAPPQQPAQMPAFQMPGTAPAPTWQQTPPQQAAPQQPMGIDLSPVLGQIDLVGKAVNALGAASESETKQLLSILSDIKTLLYVQVAATHHIYMGQAHIAPTLQGQDVGDVSKFIGYMQKFIPR